MFGVLFHDAFKQGDGFGRLAGKQIEVRQFLAPVNGCDQTVIQCLFVMGDGFVELGAVDLSGRRTGQFLERGLSLPGEELHKTAVERERHQGQHDHTVSDTGRVQPAIAPQHQSTDLHGLPFPQAETHQNEISGTHR